MVQAKGSKGAAVAAARRSPRRRPSAPRGARLDEVAALGHLTTADPRLGRLIVEVGPYALEPQAPLSTFVALAEAIVYQQLTGRAAATIFGRVRALSGRRAFPSPAEILALPDGALRAAGLSRAKTAALKDLAKKSLDGTVPSIAALREMEEEAIVARLTAVRGIGRWTVEMLLIFRLGRPDVLPVGDYGIRKGFARAFGTRALPTPRQVVRRGERWRPYRTIASWYLWQAARKDAETPPRPARQKR